VNIIGHIIPGGGIPWPVTPAHPGNAGQTPEGCKTDVCVCVPFDRCADTSSHAIVPWVQTHRPIEGRGDGGGGAAACDWLVGGGYGTPIDARVAQCKNCHNLCDVLL